MVCMVKGINCVVWNVQGTTATKKVNSQMKDSITYILNEEKTDCIFPMQDSPISNTTAQLNRECQYVENDIKTFHGAFVGGINVISTDSKEVVQEMMEVKKFYGKLDGRGALHGVLTLDEEESDISNGPALMKLCEDVLKELFPKHQAIFAVHTNTDNLHVHFIINSVGLDGKKIHQPDGYINKTVHPVVNKAAMKYGFTPNIKWENKNVTITSYVELKMQLREQIDLAIESSSDFEGFIENLRKSGLIVNIGKYISIGLDDLPKAVRTYQLGSNYTKDSIVNRIATRKNTLKIQSVSDLTLMNETQELVLPSIINMKKYKDMNPEEKANTISLLRLGKNPWKMTRQINWQLEEMANQVNNVYRATELIKHYSVKGSAQEALDVILDAKRTISDEKKQIRADVKINKPLIEIYKEMKTIEKRAYLFEYEHVTEYKEDYNRYRELTHRLKTGYDKTFIEVSEYIESCNEQILYAHAQLHELSNEYREIRKYVKEHGNSINVKDTLLEAIGLDEAKKNDKRDIHTSEVFYVTSKTSDVMMRVIKGVEINKYGNLSSKFEIVIMNKYGEVLESLQANVGNKDFYKQVKVLESTYGFIECEKYYSVNQAREYLWVSQREMVTNGEKKPRTIREKSEAAPSQKEYSFTQAINLESVKDKDGVHVILNSENPAYMVVVLTNENYINIQVVDKFGKIQKRTELPSIREKNQIGYETIMALQKEYGFSDKMITLDNIEAARMYMGQSEGKTQNDRIHR